jgi:hypothetical protein
MPHATLMWASPVRRRRIEYLGLDFVYLEATLARASDSVRVMTRNLSSGSAQLCSRERDEKIPSTYYSANPNTLPNATPVPHDCSVPHTRQQHETGSKSY